MLETVKVPSMSRTTLNFHFGQFSVSDWLVGRLAVFCFDWRTKEEAGLTRGRRGARRAAAARRRRR
jgi:hypothetical protein